MATLPNLEVFAGNDSFALAAPSYTDARVLSANTAETVTVPTHTNNQPANFVVFSSTANFYVNYTGTAAVPAADVTDGTASELNPTVRYIARVGDFSIISPEACIVTMSFFI